MQTVYNFSKTSTENLLRTYRRQDTDLTETMEGELRRQYFLQEAGAELQRRGVAL